MSNADGLLHLVRLSLRGASVMRAGRKERLPMHEVDTGYLAHCVLGQLFREEAPRPFHLERVTERRLRLLAYSTSSVDRLRETARRFADPDISTIWDADDAKSKRMPGTWRTGRRVAFEVRVCPVVRMAREGPTHRKGAEVDAFLAACWRAGPDTRVDREAIYSKWLHGRLEQGGAETQSSSMVRFRRTRLLRRTHGAARKGRLCERPDATFCGVLRIVDGARFSYLLRRGIGRHCGFGFGMLLLRLPHRR